MNRKKSLGSLAQDFTNYLHSMKNTEMWGEKNQVSYFGYIRMQATELMARWDGMKEQCKALHHVGIRFDLLHVSLVENGLVQLDTKLRSEADSEERDLRGVAQKVDFLHRVWFGAD